MRWWDGIKWTENFGHAIPTFAPNAPGNSTAIASLVLGLVGVVVTAIPLFIGLIFGGIPDLLAVIFGIVGLINANKLNGKNMGFAIAGLILGAFGLLGILLGAGTIW
jgi:hypothetical protein